MKVTCSYLEMGDGMELGGWWRRVEFKPSPGSWTDILDSSGPSCSETKPLGSALLRRLTPCGSGCGMLWRSRKHLRCSRELLSAPQ